MAIAVQRCAGTHFVNAPESAFTIDDVSYEAHAARYPECALDIPTDKPEAYMTPEEVVFLGRVCAGNWREGDLAKAVRYHYHHMHEQSAPFAGFENARAIICDAYVGLFHEIVTCDL